MALGNTETVDERRLAFDKHVADKGVRGVVQQVLFNEASGVQTAREQSFTFHSSLRDLVAAEQAANAAEGAESVDAMFATQRESGRPLVIRASGARRTSQTG